MSDRIYCLCGCGLPLMGKQRKYRSDACRKRHQRNADMQSVRKSAKNLLPLNCTVDLTPFADMELSALHHHLITCLNSAAQYEDVWAKRILAKPNCFKPGQLEIHQATHAILQGFVDDLSNLTLETSE